MIVPLQILTHRDPFFSFIFLLAAMATQEIKITINGQSVSERSLCSRIFSGDAGCLVNTLCCPVVMPFHATRIYVFSCGWVYFTWAFDKAFCAIFRLICACCCIFKDNSFPPDAKSIGEWDGLSLEEVNKKIKWVRATEHFESKFTEEQKKQGVRVKLFEEGIEAKDVAQGELGNCWLVAALACMAEYPGLLRGVRTRPHPTPPPAVLRAACVTLVVTALSPPPHRDRCS